MANSIETYLSNDADAPAAPKIYLQGYDNYGIYDIFCIDDLANSNVIGSGFLAVQAYSVEPVTCNFIEIVNSYH
jgi:hypothetical protein